MLQRGFLRRTVPLLGMEQIKADEIKSTTRINKGHHRGPKKRTLSIKERNMYNYIRQWELKSAEEWNDLERFSHLPKPKQQFGNEMCEVVWPYLRLIEEVIHVHPFTRSIYVYYPQHTGTDNGRKAKEVAVQFARECLVPITYHNPQTYVECEMLLEYSETPYVVINCIDGQQSVLPISKDKHETKYNVLDDVVKQAEQFATNTKDPKAAWAALNERPLQNQYLRVDHQWFTPEQREQMQSTFNYNYNEVRPRGEQVQRSIYNKLGYAPVEMKMPTKKAVSARIVAPNRNAAPKDPFSTFFNSSPTHNPRGLSGSL